MVEPERVILSFEVPADKAPLLLAALGSVASQYGLDIPDLADGRISAAETSPSFNPDRVTNIFDSATGKIIPVITEQNLTSFEKEQLSSTLFSVKLSRSLSSVFHYNFDIYKAIQPDLQPFVLLTPSGHFVGIRADQAKDLLALLNGKHINLPNVGDSTLRFFNRFCKDLIEQPAEDSKPQPDMSQSNNND
ncbi:MAG: hypothetical protein ACYCPS_00390 [Candidatus Saccharimonadales bacterium]